MTRLITSPWKGGACEAKVLWAGVRMRAPRNAPSFARTTIRQSALPPILMRKKASDVYPLGPINSQVTGWLIDRCNAANQPISAAPYQCADDLPRREHTDVRAEMTANCLSRALPPGRAAAR
jgi:hypothetical protein